MSSAHCYQVTTDLSNKTHLISYVILMFYFFTKKRTDTENHFVVICLRSPVRNSQITDTLNKKKRVKRTSVIALSDDNRSVTRQTELLY